MNCYLPERPAASYFVRAGLGAVTGWGFKPCVPEGSVGALLLSASGTPKYRISGNRLAQGSRLGGDCALEAETCSSCKHIAVSCGLVKKR